MTKTHAAQISALAVALVFVSCALLTVAAIDSSADTGDAFDSGTDTDGLSTAGTQTNSNGTKAGTINNIANVMAAYFNTDYDSTPLPTNITVSGDRVLNESSALIDGTTITFNENSTLVVDGCSLYICGDISLNGDVSVTLINGASLYLGKILICTSTDMMPCYIEGPSFDLEFSASNDIKSSADKNAELHLVLDIKGDRSIMAEMGDYSNEYGFKITIGSNPDGKEIDIDLDISIGDFLTFINEKYEGTTENETAFTLDDVISYALSDDGVLPTTTAEVHIFDMKCYLNLSTVNTAYGITSMLSFIGNFDIRAFDLTLNTNSTKDGESCKLYISTDCDKLFADLSCNTYVYMNETWIPYSTTAILLDTINSSCETTSGEMTSAQFDIDSFEFSFSNATKDTSLVVKDTTLTFDVTTSGLYGFYNLLNSIYKDPENADDLLLSADLDTFTEESSIRLDTEELSIVNNITVDAANYDSSFYLSNSTLKSILSENYLQFNSESGGAEYTKQCKDETGTYDTCTTYSEECRDVSLFIDTKDTTPNTIMKIIIQLFSLDMEQETIDKILDYTKKVNMTVNFEAGYNALQITYTKTKPAEDTGEPLLVQKEQTIFNLEDAKIYLCDDTNGDNKIEVNAALFELMTPKGAINENSIFVMNTSTVIVYDLDFCVYSDYGYMYKLLVGLGLYIFDEEHEFEQALEKILAAFIFEPSSDTTIDLYLRYAEVGNKTELFNGSQLISTIWNVGCIGDKDSSTQDIEVHLVLDLEYNDKAVSITKCTLNVIADKDAALVVKYTDSSNNYERNVTVRSGRLYLTLSTPSEGLSMSSLLVIENALKQISVIGNINWNEYSTIQKSPSSSAGSLYQESLSYINASLKVESNVSDIVKAFKDERINTDILMAVKDVIYAYEEESVNASLKLINSQGKETLLKSVTFSGVSIEFVGDNDYVKRAKSVDVLINDGTHYDMQTDGDLYFKSTFKLNFGYELSNGVDTYDDAKDKWVYVDSFSISDKSKICAGIESAAVGTQLKLTHPTELVNKNGLQFRGWYLINTQDNTKIFIPADDNTYTLYAPSAGSYKIEYAYGYILTFDTDGGETIGSMCLEEYDYIDVSKYTPSKTGYTFIEWDTSTLQGNDNDRMVGNDATIKAVWRANTYKVTLDANGGTLDSDVESTFTYEYGTKVSLPDANDIKCADKEGYRITFEGWYESSDPSKTIVTSIDNPKASDLTYIAKWNEEALENKVIFDANGGTVNTSELSFRTGEAVDISSVSAAREGYILHSWQDYTDGMKMPGHSITLKAVWAKIITDTQISTDDEKVTIDIDSDAASLSKDKIEELIKEQNGKTIELNFDNLTIGLTSEAIKKMSYKYGDYSDINMSISYTSNISESLTDQLNGSTKKIEKILSINVNSSGTTNELGEVTVSIPLTDDMKGTDYTVYYVDSDGNMTKMTSRCETIDGVPMIIFTTDHFSDYAIVSNTSSEPSNSSNISIYIIIAIIAVILVLIIAAVYVKKVKQ